MAVTNPPGWLQNAGSTHTAAQLRQYLAGLVAGNFSSATGLRARGGIHPSLGDEFRTHQAGSPNMTVITEPGICCIPGSESGAQANYWACNDAAVTLSITAAHASLPRIDIVVVNIRDTFYSGVNNDSQLQVIAGTPASSPVPPSAPANSITICQVAVGAAVTSIVDANITDLRFYLAATGGVINARTDAARPASTEINVGQLAYSMDVSKLYIWDGSAYNQMFPAGYTKIAENILVGTSANINFSSIPQIYRSLEIWMVSRSDTAATSTNGQIRFNGDISAIYDSQQLTGNATTAAAFETVGGTLGFIGEVTAASSTANAASVSVIRIPFYRGTTFWKDWISNHALTVSTGSAGVHSKQWTGRWRNTAAITSIDIFPGAGNFIAGSSFVLYGIL